MFNFDVYEDKSGNVRAQLPSRVAHYTVVFTEFGTIATVAGHQTEPLQRSDLSILTVDLEVVSHSTCY